MREKDRLMIKKFLGEVQCPKEFTCVASGLGRLCEAEDIGLPNALKCLQDNAGDCPFSAPCRGRFYCSCPLRVYLRKHLKI
jgi:hypothetical protein